MRAPRAGRFAPFGGLKLTHQEDRTEDYRQTSIREREHFGWLKYGCTPPAFLTSALTLVTDPHWLIFHVDLARAFFGWESCWMWHIGGLDPNTVCKKCMSPRLDAAIDVSELKR